MTRAKTTCRGPGALLLVWSLLLVAAAPGAAAAGDPYRASQYGLDQIGAPAAWARSRGAKVTIAVVDSGVDLEHPDLAGKLDVRPGSDFGDRDDRPDDDSTVEDGAGTKVRGHGTHVAGIAAAVTDNGIGVAGVAPDARIMPVKVFGRGGTIATSLTVIPDAISFAVDNGAEIVNLSVGTFQGLSLIGLIETPCAEAFRRGALCVVSAGNGGQDNRSGYPSNLQALIVTANDEAGQHASFGQKADTQWGISAPGTQILSTFPVEDGSYVGLSGTSMSAPHASGVAALLFAQGLTNAQVVERMLSTAKPMGDQRTNGAGLVDAAAALGVERPSGGSGGDRRGRDGSAPAPVTSAPAVAPTGGGTATTPPPAGPAPAGEAAPFGPGLNPRLDAVEDDDQSGTRPTVATVAGLLAATVAAWGWSIRARQVRAARLAPFR